MINNNDFPHSIFSVWERDDTESFLNKLFILCYFREEFLNLVEKKTLQILTNTTQLEGNQSHWWGKFFYIVM